MIMAKIGFVNYDRESDKSPSEVKKSSAGGEQSPKCEVSPKELFRQFLLSRYAASGQTEAMVFRTSRELAYEAREMCEPSLPDIAAVMTELKFASNQFMGVWTWVLYETTEYRY